MTDLNKVRADALLAAAQMFTNGAEDATRNGRNPEIACDEAAELIRALAAVAMEGHDLFDAVESIREPRD